MKKALAFAALLLLVPLTARAQTQGTIVYDSPDLQAWTLTIASGDSISSYVRLPESFEFVSVLLDSTAGDSIGIHIEGAVITSGVSNSATYTLSTFTDLKTVGMVIDTLAAGVTTAIVDLTSRVQGLAAFRLNYGSTGDVWGANSAETIYVLIRKKRR